jgi:hypothetical protein
MELPGDASSTNMESLEPMPAPMKSSNECMDWEEQGR